MSSKFTDRKLKSILFNELSSSFVTRFLLRLLLLSVCKFDSICFVCHQFRVYWYVCISVYMHEFSYILLLTLLSQGIFCSLLGVFVRSRFVRPYIVFDSTIFYVILCRFGDSHCQCGGWLGCGCVCGTSAQNIFKSHWNRSKCAINWSHSHTLTCVHRTAHMYNTARIPIGLGPSRSGASARVRNEIGFHEQHKASSKQSECCKLNGIECTKLDSAEWFNNFVFTLATRCHTLNFLRGCVRVHHISFCVPLTHTHAHPRRV